LPHVVERFFLKKACLDRRLVTAARLPKGNQGGFHLNANLVLEFAQAHFGLPKLQLISRQIGPGGTVAQGHIELKR